MSSSRYPGSCASRRERDAGSVDPVIKGDHDRVAADQPGGLTYSDLRAFIAALLPRAEAVRDLGVGTGNMAAILAGP